MSRPEVESPKNYTEELLRVAAFFDKTISDLQDQIKSETDQDLRRILLERLTQEGKNKNDAIRRLGEKGNVPATVFNNCTVNGVNTGGGVMNIQSIGGSGVGSESAPRKTQAESVPQQPKSPEGSDSKKPTATPEARKEPAPVPEKFQRQLDSLIELMESTDRKNIYDSSTKDNQADQANMVTKNASAKRIRDKLDEIMKDAEFKKVIREGTYEELNLRVRYLTHVLNYHDSDGNKDPRGTQEITKQLHLIEERLKKFPPKNRTSQTSKPATPNPPGNNEPKPATPTQNSAPEVEKPKTTEEMKTIVAKEFKTLLDSFKDLQNGKKFEVKAFLESIIAKLTGFEGFKNEALYELLIQTSNLLSFLDNKGKLPKEHTSFSTKCQELYDSLSNDDKKRLPDEIDRLWKDTVSHSDDPFNTPTPEDTSKKN